nr:alpha-tocopherol transfer protein-like [Leptinotarsa decemlineata]XP_023027032.1 alpha-tocopherol transfer protein-like [Leptinotarsa decemlineata]XP_023027033.1 alpha-tocopherol transfer protein-like [Leptinotarsa decemlineata]XP_023027035.1 alpha-tocopherol transfer protein-like [Leptinotarsa decemlineata]XP_023027036.1 alpha-tocopherol transfer protein-like [Leptinotarsa decemlineata]XP_023027037.1 alpha-tocopherol transfer protein-like [Leptinotarsa decemlineata]XP_023027038.1 alpha-to
MVLCIETGLDNIPFIQLGTHQMRLDLEELRGKDKQRAEKELRETPENVEFGLTKLREILKADEGLYIPFDDESFLIKFLRPCRYNPETAAKIIRKFYRFKIKHPKYSVNITPQSIRHVFDSEVYKLIPIRTTAGSRVLVINCGAKWNPKQVTLEDLFKATMVTIEIAMLEPKTQLGGVHVIIDMDGFSLLHVCQFSPQTAKLILDWVQECNPTRLKGIHIINQSNFFSMVFTIFKPFLGEKLKKLLFLHGTNRKSLLEKISSESLPAYYGGTAEYPEYPGSLFADMLFYYEKDFEVYNTYGYVTTKVKA